MTCQPSTSSFAQENICEISNIIEDDEIDKHESNTKISTKVFTKKEEIALLKKIKEDNRSICICKSCTMEHLKILAYKVAREKRKTYPKSWDKNRQVKSEWLKKFEKRHKNEILKLPFNCKKILSHNQASTREGQRSHSDSQFILTIDDEQLLLTQLQELKTRYGNKHINFFKSKALSLAYKIAHKYRRYPKSWDRNKQAGKKWMKRFVDKYKDEISKIPSVCKNEMSANKANDRKSTISRNYNEDERLLLTLFAKTVEMYQTNKANDDVTCKSTILTKEDERLLLTQLQEMETQHGCKCRSCIMKEAPFLAYTIAHDKKRLYPESWDRDKQAGRKWVKFFVTRHKDEISKFSSVCKNEMPINTINNRPTALTKEDERLLLRQLQEIETQYGCRCKNCILKEVSILAYKIARKYERRYPEAWDKDKQAGRTWVRCFKIRHKDEISKFSSVCKYEMPINRINSSFTVLTKEDERLLLRQLQEIETQHGCKCKNCIMKEVPILAYKIAHDKKRLYPESWSENEKAGRDWLNNFKERYKDEISKFSSVCKNEMLINTINRSTVLTKEDERLLLRQLQEIETQHGCKCKNCMMKEVPILAYKIARKYERSYPETWNRDKEAGPTWVRFFVARHKDEISKFSSVCKYVLTNRANKSKSTVLTKEDERLLLTQLQEIETQHGCKCKNCIMKEALILAYTIAHDKKRLYPKSWDRDKQAGESWMKFFVARYKNEISKFSSVCKKHKYQTKANDSRPTILIKEDEQLLLTQLQEMETQ